MTSNAADRVPDEIVSEILTPLLKHSVEIFCDPSEKQHLHLASSRLNHGFACRRRYCIILRANTQAAALETALKTTK
jgi:hypothetical protein